MMKTIIIEDEPFVAKDLQKAINQIAPELEITRVIPSLKQAVEWFTSGHPEPDLLFMDIQLADGVSLDLFKQVKLDCPVIFTTAYDEYALRAFKLNSIDYLLKPVDPEELKAAIDKFKKYRTNKTELAFGDRIESMLSMIQSGDLSRKFKERFMVSSRNAIMPVHQSQIAYFTKSELIYVHTFENQKFVGDYDTMDQIEQVANPDIFFRANRQFILHINAVEKYQTGSNSKLNVKLKSPMNIEIEISREKAAAFKEWLNH